MEPLRKLAELLARFEGFYIAGSRSQRNNNPGNLRAGPRAISKDSAGYAVYATAADGWADLYRQIDLDAGRGLTLEGFIGKYAPPSENPTANYLAFVAGQLGVSPSVSLASVISAESPPANPNWDHQGITADWWSSIPAIGQPVFEEISRSPWVLPAAVIAVVSILWLVWE